MIVTEGARGTDVFVLLRGSVKVFSVADTGREITYEVLAPGEIFGETSLDGGPRSASVVALEACECALVGPGDIRDHLQAEPNFALELVVYAIRRARAATEVARKMALLDVYGRLVSLLEEQCAVGVDGGPVERINLNNTTHREIASRVGASREMVSRLLKDLERGGYIEMQMRQIILLKKLPQRW